MEISMLRLGCCLPPYHNSWLRTCIKPNRSVLANWYLRNSCENVKPRVGFG